MAKIVGLTGGIGSGKTTVAKMFQDLGVPIYIADIEAKKITNKPSTLALIEEKFGSSVIKNKKLNRGAIAKIVFSAPEKLKELNDIIHPLVAIDFKQWLKQVKDKPFVIKEAAILFETNMHLQCDYVITVSAPEKIRIERVLQRDPISEMEIKNRMDNQYSDEKRLKLSDFVIENINIDVTLQQVNDIYQTITNSL